MASVIAALLPLAVLALPAVAAAQATPRQTEATPEAGGTSRATVQPRRPQPPLSPPLRNAARPAGQAAAPPHAGTRQAGSARPRPAAVPAPSSPGGAPSDLDGWWQRQREREARDRFWNGPREQRRALTRDQFEQWDRQRERRFWRPHFPY